MPQLDPVLRPSSQEDEGQGRTPGHHLHRGSAQQRDSDCDRSDSGSCDIIYSGSCDSIYSDSCDSIDRAGQQHKVVLLVNAVGIHVRFREEVTQGVVYCTSLICTQVLQAGGQSLRIKDYSEWS